MAEFIGEKYKNVNIGEPIVFENKTDSEFEVSAGIVFHKSGIYEVSVLKNKTIVSKVTERENGEWERKSFYDSTPICSECGIEGRWDFEYCPYCGADMKGE